MTITHAAYAGPKIVATDYTAAHLISLFGIPGTTVNIYVSNTGNDANSGLTTTLPKLTLQAAIDLVPDIYDKNYVINVASGAHTDTNVVVYNKHAVGSVSLVIKGYQNSAVNQFTNTPAISSTCTGAGGGGNWPTAKPYLLDAGQNFAAYKGSTYLLHITGGTGWYNTATPLSTSNNDFANWYKIATSAEDAGNTHLPIIGSWLIATPDNTTTYEILSETQCNFTATKAGLNLAILNIYESSHVAVRNIGFIGTGFGTLIEVADLDNTVLYDHSYCWWGIYIAPTNGTSVVGINIRNNTKIELAAFDLVGGGFTYANLQSDYAALVYMRSIYSTGGGAAGYGLVLNTGWYEVDDIYVLSNGIGIDIENGMVEFAHGWYVKSNTGVGVEVRVAGQLALYHDALITLNGDSGVQCFEGSLFKGVDSTVHSDSNTGYGVKTSENSISQGSLMTLAGNSIGAHLEATGGLWK